jgi:hypothetical protein
VTNQEVEEACGKFMDYLRANGRRPIALVIEVCNDRENTEQLIACGLRDVLDDACLRTLCNGRGFRMDYK